MGLRGLFTFGITGVGEESEFRLMVYCATVRLEGNSKAFVDIKGD